MRCNLAVPTATDVDGRVDTHISLLAPKQTTSTGTLYRRFTGDICLRPFIPDSRALGYEKVEL